MRILLASDGSSDARRAIRWLRDVSLTSGTAVTVLTVATLPEPPRDAQTMSDVRACVRDDARRAGEGAAKILKRRWGDVETVVTEGDPRVEIVHVAAERRVEMIVLGARGLGRVKRLFIGSTSLGGRPLRRLPGRDRTGAAAQDRTYARRCRWVERLTGRAPLSFDLRARA
jgi:nucleotide-binding universal stress UspA family protein